MAVSGDRRIVFDGSVPLQHQIYLQLRREIADGLWTGRSDFPGEKELASRFDVSVITSKAALNRLADEGWVERRRGRGTRALPIPERPSDGAKPPLLPVGPRRDYTYRVLSTVESTAPADACTAFGLPPGASLWQCSRLRSFNGKPHSVTHNAQLPEVGRRHSRRGLNRLPMGVILESEGLTRARIHRRLSATHAPPLVAAHLGLTIVDPVLEAVFTVEDPSGSTVEWVRIFLHPDNQTPEESMDLRTGTWCAAEPI